MPQDIQLWIEIRFPCKCTVNLKCNISFAQTHRIFQPHCKTSALSVDVWPCCGDPSCCFIIGCSKLWSPAVVARSTLVSFSFLLWLFSLGNHFFRGATGHWRQCKAFGWWCVQPAHSREGKKGTTGHPIISRSVFFQLSLEITCCCFYSVFMSFRVPDIFAPKKLNMV